MTISPRTSLRPIMLVDDSVDDVFLVTRALQRAGARNPIQIARDGEEAVQLLAKGA